MERNFNRLWEHPHDSKSPSSVTQNIQFSIFPPTKTLIHAPNQTTTISPRNITATLPLSFSPSLQLALFGATSMGNRSTIHAYQLCQLANGRPGWTAGDQHKRGQFSKL
jgi:hypothetical protein